MIFGIFYISAIAGFLGYFAVVDWRKREIENLPILLFIAVAASWPTFVMSLPEIVPGASVVVAVLFLLWRLRLIGGADFKIGIGMAIIFNILAIHIFAFAALAGGFFNVFGVQNGKDVLSKKEWKGIPLMTFVFPFFVILTLNFFCLAERFSRHIL